jgi:hypothetical protein
MVNRLISLEEWEARQMQDPEFVAALAELEAAYQEARLRNIHRLMVRQSEVSSPEDSHE